MPPAVDATDALVYAIQLALAGVLVFAAASKARDFRGFRETLAAYELLPKRIVAPTTALVIVAESATSAALASGITAPAAIAAAGVLFGGFAIAVGVNLRRGRAIPCGCFGDDAMAISGLTLVRLALLLTGVVSLALFAVRGHPLVTPSRLTPGGVASTLHFLVASAGLAASLVLAGAWSIALRDLLTLARIGPAYRRRHPAK